MVYTLMNQTLPTIVGAGVVSRTTETMFGRRLGNKGRRAVTRTKTGAVIHQGPRGGRYIIKRGRKRYL